MLTRTVLISLFFALSSGFYAFAGTLQKPKMISWTIFLVSSAVLAAAALVAYFRFILIEIPYLGGA